MLIGILANFDQKPERFTKLHFTAFTAFQSKQRRVFSTQSVPENTTPFSEMSRRKAKILVSFPQIPDGTIYPSSKPGRR